MKKLLLMILVISINFSMEAQDYLESINSLSRDYGDTFLDIESIRQINGGTVIIPSFDSSCPEDIKAPFAFACKILEEYLPPCLPLEVNVSCGSFVTTQVSEKLDYKD